LATNLLRRPDLAEDVLQDVFVKFIESVDAFELTGSLKGYLATCIANRSRDILRRERHRGGVALEAAECIESKQHGPLRVVIANEDERRLDAALTELPYEQRETVLLHVQGGLRFREIAQVQGVSAKTVESRYRYGLNRLRSMLNGQVKP
jgi:RNA polymerase sigma-70 factor (ECF subfamily)